MGGIGPKDGQGREGQVEISLGERLEAESEKFSGSCSMSELGIQVWWILQRADENSRQTFFKTFASRQKEFFREVCQNLRVTRKKRALFPLPNFWESTLTDFPDVDLLQLTERNKRETSDFAVACWCSLAVLFVNHLHDKRWQYASEQPTKSQRDMLMQIQEGVQRVLKEDCLVTWGEAEIKKDLSKKNVSYNGEEVSRPETLEIEQVLPGLPPQDHGGRIPITEWVSGKCKWYLEHPKECLLGPDTEPGVKLTAKVHVKPEDKLALGKLLVERRICRWTREDHVLCHKGEKVLNGLFGVEKPKRLPSGKPILRLIMNLIPSNSIHKTLSGRVHQLPHITRWAGLVLEEGEVLHVCQSDMQSAFYLFSLPEDWSCHLSFNLWAWGSELGLTGSEEQMRFYLSCAVLPMGWSSAVGVMQFVAEEVLYRNGMEKVTQIRRSNVLPEWMIRSCEDAAQEGKYWWHVYLDNYASGEKVQTGSPKAGEWQVLVEGWWEQAGIVTSKDKTIKDATTATELGAFISGNNRWIGASCERLLKVCKTTLWLISQPTIPRKLLQVIMGRWVFIMQFRRPAMSHFEAVWEVISEKEKGEKVLAEVRRELLGAVLGCLLFHTFLGCRIQKEITCSDASTTGGAVAVSYQLSKAGEKYLQSLEPGNAPLKVPVVCISLFNGIGAAFRCYDVAGVQLAGGIACDIHRPGHRVTSRRWPWVVLVGDIKDLTKESLETMLEEMDEFLEIHLWAGFPCVDLSSVKSNRLNLQGPQSSLIHEAIRVMKLLHELYPNKKLVFVFENVASMDQSARVEISELIGVQPFKVDPAQQVPMNRPRLCWTNVVLPESDCIHVEQRGDYQEVIVTGQYPNSADWLDEDSWQTDEDVVYPTCMKSIVRNKPPDRPAGLHRCDEGTIARWKTHRFRFPPYQYKSQYLIWDDRIQSCRLLNSDERERLMGLGSGHTQVCFSASKAKANKSAYEDERLSLIGDSFAIPSFMLFAAAAVFEHTKQFDVTQMQNRLGLPPGAASALSVNCPLSKTLSYGSFSSAKHDTFDMNIHLARRANHTGSDIRITTGEVLNPRQLARQSVVSAWWQWTSCFRVKWEMEEHINPLECRAILLSIMWKLRKGNCTARKFFHLTDSYVCQSILSKGRTSSKLMQPIVRRVNSLLLASCCQLYLAHVDSSDNPTDGGSRKA